MFNLNQGVFPKYSLTIVIRNTNILPELTRCICQVFNIIVYFLLIHKLQFKELCDKSAISETSLLNFFFFIISCFNLVLYLSTTDYRLRYASSIKLPICNYDSYQTYTDTVLTCRFSN